MLPQLLDVNPHTVEGQTKGQVAGQCGCMMTPREPKKGRVEGEKGSI